MIDIDAGFSRRPRRALGLLSCKINDLHFSYPFRWLDENVMPLLRPDKAPHLGNERRAQPPQDPAQRAGNSPLSSSCTIMPIRIHFALKARAFVIQAGVEIFPGCSAFAFEQTTITSMSAALACLDASAFGCPALEYVTVARHHWRRDHQRRDRNARPEFSHLPPRS